MGTAIENYGQLKKAIVDYADRTDIDKILPTIIGLAEKKIFRELRGPENEQKTWFDAKERTFHFTVPDRLIEIKNIRYTSIPKDCNLKPDYTLAETIDFLPPSLFHKSENQCGWTRERENIWFKNGIGPNTRVIITYWMDQSGLNEDTDTSKVLQKCWDLYLFGSLAELAPYLVDDKRIQLWEAKFRSSMDALNSYHMQLDYRTGTSRIRIR